MNCRGMVVCCVSPVCRASQAQRGRKTPQKHVWELPGHASRRLPDLEELIGEQARERTQVSSSAQLGANRQGTGTNPLQ